MKRRGFLKHSLTASAGLLLTPMFSRAGWLTSGKEGVNSFDDVANYFISPPGEARSWVFWQWMNGNITKEGITLDLEAMERMGIGGALCFNNAVGIAKGPVDYASKEWLNMTEHAVVEAQRLGLKIMLHNSPGYSGTGGPWVTPEMSMQQLVWSETLVSSKGKIKLSLPKPMVKHHYYQDAMVIAYPSLGVEKVLMRDALISVTANDEVIDINILTDRNPDTKIRLERKDNLQSTLVFQFKEAFEARAISLLRKAETPIDLFDGPRDYPPIFTIEISDDGINYKQIATLNCPALREMDAPASQIFDAVKAKFFKLSANRPTWVSEVELHSGPRISQWPAKVNYSSRVGEELVLDIPEDLIIQPESVINVSSHVNDDGFLSWKAPKGNWTIIRIGHTTTGEEPAAHPDSGKGLEIDKFSREALDFHLDCFLGDVLDRLKPYTSFRGVTTDSWEAGKQNWTVKLPEEFKQRRKYDILQWMPALTGRIVKSIDETERFLWDFRKTHADLLANNYSAYYAAKMHERGLDYHAEPYGDGVFDSLEVGKHLSVPMSEFWTRYIYGSDMTSKQAASIAHAYAKPVVMAEAFTGMPLTSKWGEYPYSLKAEADWFYSLGVNRLALHVFVHQPYTTGFPGMTMGPFGTHFDRNDVWTEQAKGWLNYTTRSQYLLQQGIPVIDICYYKGDNPGSGIPDVYPLLPKGYKADVIGFSALQERLSVSNNRIVLPDGMQYQIMILPALAELQPATVRKMRDLVVNGMVLLVENKPRKTLGRNAKNADLEKEVSLLYGELDGENIKERSLGRGKVYWGASIADVLRECDVKPDFLYSSEKQDATIHYYHKRMDNSDLYFISNHRRRQEKIVVSLNLKNKQPFLWDAETGIQTKIAMFDQKNGRTMIPLDLAPAASVFIVFKELSRERAVVSVFKNEVLLRNSEAFEPVDLYKYRNITNDFTIHFWAKPDTFAHNNKSMVFHAPQAGLLYGKDHAAVAISLGQNIIRIYERNTGPNREVLSVEQSITGYTHIALIYRDGVPALYINGQPVKTGEKSAFIVHPGIETPALDEQYSSYFEGNLTDIQLVGSSWNDQDVKAEFNKRLPSLSLLADVKISGGSQAAKVLFTKNAKFQFNLSDGQSEIIDIKTVTNTSLAESWAVTFPSSSGVGKKIELEQLTSLHLHHNFDVRHFSGTCVYERSIQIDRQALQPGNRYILDLGRVEVIANVKVNGSQVQLLWKEPFVADITDALRAGANSLEIEVTTLWPNRLIGDEHLPDEHEYSEHGFIFKLPDWYVNNKPKPGERKAFSVWKNFKKTDPLLASGLLGPVTLIKSVEKEIQL